MSAPILLGKSLALRPITGDDKPILLDNPRDPEFLRMVGEDESSSTSLTDSEFCFWHDPKNEKAIQKAVRKGGKITAKRKDAERWMGKTSINTLEDVRGILNNLLEETHDKIISPQTCTACVGVLREFRELLTDVILAEKVKALHEYLNERGLIK